MAIIKKQGKLALVCLKKIIPFLEKENNPAAWIGCIIKKLSIIRIYLQKEDLYEDYMAWTFLF